MDVKYVLIAVLDTADEKGKIMSKEEKDYKAGVTRSKRQYSTGLFTGPSNSNNREIDKDESKDLKNSIKKCTHCGDIRRDSRMHAIKLFIGENKVPLVTSTIVLCNNCAEKLTDKETISFSRIREIPGDVNTKNFKDYYDTIHSLFNEFDFEKGVPTNSGKDGIKEEVKSGDSVKAGTVEMDNKGNEKNKPISKTLGKK